METAMSHSINDESGTEHHLVRDAKKGDRQAFSLLYERHVKSLYNFIYHKTFCTDTAKDLTQIVFLKAIENLDRYDPDQGTWSSWLFAIARNKVIDHFRTRHLNLAIDDVWDLADPADVELDAVNRDRFERLHTELNRLEAGKRELLMLRLWQELSFEEIAKCLGKTESACKMAFHRLLKELREEMPTLLLLLLILRP
jgi:RNA polymerase sigma-70 factor (ECF subfamily)